MLDFLFNSKGDFREFTEIIKYIKADSVVRDMMNTVPPRCSRCKALLDCRRLDGEYRCKKGCLVINAEIYLRGKCRNCFLLPYCRDEYKNYHFKHNKCLLGRKGAEYKPIIDKDKPL